MLGEKVTLDVMNDIGLETSEYSLKKIDKKDEKAKYQKARKRSSKYKERRKFLKTDQKQRHSVQHKEYKYKETKVEELMESQANSSQDRICFRRMFLYW